MAFGEGGRSKVKQWRKQCRVGAKKEEAKGTTSSEKKRREGGKECRKLRMERGLGVQKTKGVKEDIECKKLRGKMTVSAGKREEGAQQLQKTEGEGGIRVQKT